jgi:hypothetical protein
MRTSISEFAKTRNKQYENEAELREKVIHSVAKS